MKGAGLSVQDLKLLFHVTPNKLLNDKNVTTLSISKKKLQKSLITHLYKDKKQTQELYQSSYVVTSTWAYVWYAFLLHF